MSPPRGCGLVDDRTATSVYEGKTYAFCCDGCKQSFDENPRSSYTRT